MQKLLHVSLLSKQTLGLDSSGACPVSFKQGQPRLRFSTAYLCRAVHCYTMVTAPREPIMSVRCAVTAAATLKAYQSSTSAMGKILQKRLEDDETSILEHMQDVYEEGAFR